MWKIGYSAQEGSSNAVSDEDAASKSPHISSHADTSPASSAATRSKGPATRTASSAQNDLMLYKKVTFARTSGNS